jgi:hypothetical protein
MATPPGHAPNADKCRYMCMAPPRPTETLPMLAETNTSQTDKCCEKNLAGAPTLLQGFGGYTRGCASAPPRNSTTTRREEYPINKRQPLRVPNGYHRRGSGATVRDSHKGPLITGETPFSKMVNANKRATNPKKIHCMWSQPKAGRPTAQRNYNGPPSDRTRYPSGDSPPRSRG